MPLSCIFRHLAGRHRIIVGTCCELNVASTSTTVSLYRKWYNTTQATGVGTHDATCEAPDRPSQSSCRSPVYLVKIKILFRVKRLRGTKRVSTGIWCNLKRFLGTKCCNVTVRCYLKDFLLYHMWRMWLPSFTWLLITWSIPMEAVVGRRPFAQVLRNSLSGHPPSTGHEAWTSVGRSVTKKHYLCTQQYTKTLT